MIVSASSIQLFLTCRHKYWLSYVRGVESKQKPLALSFGGQYHKAIEVLHDSWDVGKAYKTFCNGYEDMPHDKKRTRVTAERMIRNYAQKYKDQPFKVIQNGFKYGRIMVDELKTTSQLTADYMHRFWVDYQTTIYLIAARQLVDPKINAVLADACLVSKTDPTKLKSEPFMRDIIERTPDDLEYYRNRIVQILMDMKYCLDNPDAQLWYENDQSCGNFGGCQFLYLCKEPWNMRERVIETDFVVRTQAERDAERDERFAGAKEGEFKI